MFVTVFTREVLKISFEVNSEERMTDNVLFLDTAGMFLDNYNVTERRPSLNVHGLLKYSDLTGVENESIILNAIKHL
jgi:hypothetical protein